MVSAYRSVEASSTPAVFPMSPVMEKSFEAEIYRRFMRHFRETSGSVEHRILVSIHLVSGAMGISPASTSKFLVDMGLRARRGAFPSAFLDWDFSSLPPSVVSLRYFWERNEEAREQNNNNNMN